MFQMATGLAELESWLADLFRQGLATLEGQAASYWSDLAARMVDAKLGTLARRIRQLPQLMGEGDWHEKILAELGDIYLMVRAFQRLEHLPGPLQDDLLGLSGVNTKKDDVLALPGIKDNWLVAGQTETVEEGNLLARRTWLMGETGHSALLLDFSFGGQEYETAWKMGTVVSGEAAFYPSAYPQRALLKSFEYSDQPFRVQGGFPALADFAKKYAGALAANPWLSQFSAFLENVTPVFSAKAPFGQKNKFVLVDQHRKQLPLLSDEDEGWKMIAISGGRPMRIFGTWDGRAFMPLSAVVDGQFRLLHVPVPPKREVFVAEGDLPF